MVPISTADQGGTLGLICFSKGMQNVIKEDGLSTSQYAASHCWVCVLKQENRLLVGEQKAAKMQPDTVAWADSFVNT